MNKTTSWIEMASFVVINPQSNHPRRDNHKTIYLRITGPPGVNP
jgi:hypothetical protein